VSLISIVNSFAETRVSVNFEYSNVSSAYQRADSERQFISVGDG